jgi:photosystem II stability/assembly factor-like uncharacterized protein
MRKFFLVVLLFLIFTGSNKSAVFWEPVNMPNDTEVRDIAFAKNGDIYACGYGIFKSTDGGATWTGLNDLEFMGIQLKLDEIPAIIECISVAGNGTIIAGLDDGFMFRSTDAGTGWEVLDQEIENVRDIYIDENDRIYIAHSDGISKSEDYGLTWTLFEGTESENSFGLFGVAEDGGIYAGTYTAVYYKAKDSENFIKYVDGLEGGPTVSCFAFKDNIIYAGTSYGIYISSDGGLLWELLQADLPELQFRSLTIDNQGNFYATSTDKGIFVSNNNCQNWQVYLEEMKYWRVNNIIFGDSSDFILTHGLYKFDTENDKWVKSNQGLSNPHVGMIDILKSDNSFIVATEPGFYKYDNQQQVWKELFNPDYPLIRSSLMFKDAADNLYIDQSYGGIILKSTNLGISFDKIETVTRATDMKMNSLGYLYLFDNSHSSIWHSTDNGENWSVIKFDGNMREYTIGTKDEIFYLSYDFTKLESYTGNVSYDYGATWSETKFLNHEDYIYPIDFVLDGNNIYLCESNRGFWKSTDLGESWVNSNTGIVPSPFDDDIRILDLEIVDNKLFLSTEGGVYISYDLGNNWELIDKGMGPIMCGPLKVLKDRLYVSTIKGVYRSIEPVVEVYEEQDPTLSLASVFPNPTNGQINISFLLPEESDVKVFITDILGRYVRISECGNMPSGQTKVSIPVDNVASGLYFCQLIIEKKRYAIPFFIN